MFLAITKNNRVLRMLNEAALNNFLANIPIDEWPAVIFKQIDRNNLRRVKTSFDAETSTFTHRVTKVSK